MATFFKPLVAKSIAQAKEWFSSSSASLEPKHQKEVNNILHKVISYWGFELHPEEASLPVQLGGWVSEFSEEGLDLTFITCANLPLRFEKMTNLLKIERKRLNSMPPKWKKFSSKIGEVKKILKEAILPVNGNWADYAQMAYNAVGQNRGSNASRLRIEKQYLRERLKASKKKPLTCNQLTEIFWEKVLDKGKAYAIPPSIVSIDENYSSWGRHVEHGTRKTQIQSDLLRNYFILQQKHGFLKDYTFWEASPAKDSNELLYRICSNVVENNVNATPRNILFGLILGFENWTKMIEFSERVYGVYRFPMPQSVKEISDLFFGKGQLDIPYLIDHNLELVFPMPVSDIDATEDFRARRIALEYLNKYIERTMPEDANLPILSDWSDLEQALGFDPQPYRNPNDPDEGLDLPADVDEEANRYILQAIIAQVEYVGQHISDEVNLRRDLEYQIFGRPDDADDPWDAEESFGLDQGGDY